MRFELEAVQRPRWVPWALPLILAQTSDVCSKVRIEPFEVRWLESGVLMSCGPGADLRATPAALLMERQRRAPSPCQSGSVLKIVLKITDIIRCHGSLGLGGLV